MQAFMQDFHKYLAELIGTFVLVLIGCGSAVLAGNYIGGFGIAFAFGLAVMAMVFCFGGVSGCHINPAITVAMLIAGKIKAKQAAFYVAAQCLGAIVGAAVLFVIAEGNESYAIALRGLGQNGYGEASPGGYSLGACFLTEAVMTFIFLLTIFAVTKKGAPRGVAAPAIGLVLTAIHLVSLPVTATSVNPARSLGPAVFVGGEALSQVWLFVVAPIIGAVVAALLWKIMFAEEEVPVPAEAESMTGATPSMSV